MIKKTIILFVIYLLTNVCYAINDGVLVKFEDFVLTEQDLIHDMDVLPKEQKESLQGNTKQLNDYINIYYREKLFEYLALKKKLDKTPEFLAELSAVKRRLLVNFLITEIKNNIKVPDLTDSAREYYKVNRNKFLMREQVEVRHILLKSVPGNPDKELVRQRLSDILLKIKQKTSSFQTLAKEFSEDVANAAKGGDLAKFSKGQMVKEFENEAFKLTKEGELSEVFSTKYGYHIIQLIKKYPAEIASFDRVKSLIIDKLTKTYIEDEYMRWRNEVVDPDKAQVNRDRIQRFVKKTVTKSVIH